MDISQDALKILCGKWGTKKGFVMIELNKEQIKEILPHREPMLLLDHIVIQDDKSVRATYYFTGDEWFFRGHYPGNPIVPGVILCEIMAQASCGLFVDKVKNKTPYLISIGNAKFRKKVRPQDTIVINAVFLHRKGAFYYTQCSMYRGKTLCAEGEFSFVVM